MNWLKKQMLLTKYNEIIKKTETITQVGKVTEIVGLIIEADGP